MSRCPCITLLPPVLHPSSVNWMQQQSHEEGPREDGREEREERRRREERRERREHPAALGHAQQARPFMPSCCRDGDPGEERRRRGGVRNHPAVLSMHNQSRLHAFIALASGDPGRAAREMRRHADRHARPDPTVRSLHISTRWQPSSSPQAVHLYTTHAQHI